MTVIELINELVKHPAHMEVRILMGDGFYGISKAVCTAPDFEAKEPELIALCSDEEV